MTPEAENDFIDLLRHGDMTPKRHALLRAVQEEITALRTALSEVSVREGKALAEIKRQDKFLLHLVDVVWGEANEDESVPSTDWALRMIEKAKATK